MIETEGMGEGKWNGLVSVGSTYNTSQSGKARVIARPLLPPRLRLHYIMPDNPKRKSSVTTQEPFAKRLRNNSPIVISDNSDEDIQQISPLRLTAKQKGKGRAVSELRDPPRQLCGGDIITISDDEAPALSRQKTPPEVSYPQSSKSVKGTPLEFEAYTETLSPDQMLAQFRDVSFGERMCSQCRKPIQPPQRPVCGSPLIPSILLIYHYRKYRQISGISRNCFTFSAPIVK